MSLTELSNFAGSGTDYTAIFAPDTDSTTNGVIHVDDKFSDAAGSNNQDGTDTNNKVTLTVDTTTTTPTSTPSSSSPAPATSSESSDSPSPTQLPRTATMSISFWTPPHPCSIPQAKSTANTNS